MQSWILGLTIVGLMGIATGIAYAADHEAGSPQSPVIIVVKDFVVDFDTASSHNTSAVEASHRETMGQATASGLFLHPTGTPEDSALNYDNVAIPPASDGSRPILFFGIGLREGIPWEAKTANGVRFRIAVDDKVVFEEDVTASVWKFRAVNMAAWAGRSVAISFRTNSIDGNSAYDWAVFIQPFLAQFRGTDDYLSMPKDSVGIALAEIECKSPATVAVNMGAARQVTSLGIGKHLLPIHFKQIDKVALTVEQGSADLISVQAAAHQPKLEIQSFDLSSPLVLQGQTFRALLTLKNVGLGVYRSSEELQLTALSGGPLSSLGEKASVKLPTGTLPPGAARTLVWNDLVAGAPGDWTLDVANAPDKALPLSFHVFPPAPQAASHHSPTMEVAYSPEKASLPAVSNAWSRVSIVTDESKNVYGITDTWNGNAWQRVGSIYPLARIVLQNAHGQREELPLKVASVAAESGALVLNLCGTSSVGGVWDVRVTFMPNATAPRIKIACATSAPHDTELLAFYGPTMLAGDRAFGARKSFAIFPGLEYLEGDEASSSERDLAYPLSDRRVPALHKITTPLMAVQADQSLVALLWDANQAWGVGGDQHRPAARFLAPKNDSGYDYIHMSLFAPSVGKRVTENRYEATTPYAVKRGTALEHDLWLILDNAARYPADNIVHGPHKGGLVLQAMQHWFDVYGMSEPSPAPRDWEAERALCRHAYAASVWSNDPPGWSHCQGWKPGPFVGHAVHQMLDMREGVGPEEEAGIERRIGLVIDRALREQGKHYLWSNAGCHILLGELPFYYGYVAESMKDFRKAGLGFLAARENGRWVWRPRDDKLASLGDSGGHTLGQASHPSLMALRAARFTGDPTLINQALDAVKQMEQYEVPRGAQTWECPLYQPDILASAQAIRAYCEAYRLTRDPTYLAHAKYWAWTGLPFIYMWEMDGYPTMRYNVVSVIGSTFYTHSWLGLPVVWCGLVYAYALLNLAEFDQSFDWRRVAQGINRSAMWQQYTDGPSKGCYPDSWNMIKNTPNPADIGPENILVNEFRLRGMSPEPRFARFNGKEGAIVVLNSSADIAKTAGSLEAGHIRFDLSGVPGCPAYSLLAPVPKPKDIKGSGAQVADSDELQKVDAGWMYDNELQGVVIKTTMTAKAISYEIGW